VTDETGEPGHFYFGKDRTSVLWTDTRGETSDRGESSTQVGKQNPRHPDDIAFGAATPRPTRSRAYASPASLPGPAQASLPARAGSLLAGRVSHPLDDKRSFMEPSHPSNSLRPAGPGRTVMLVRRGVVAPETGFLESDQAQNHLDNTDHLREHSRMSCCQRVGGWRNEGASKRTRDRRLGACFVGQE